MLFISYKTKHFFFCRVADLLLGGAVFNKVFQPHEAHIPYLLQVCHFLFAHTLLHLKQSQLVRS